MEIKKVNVKLAFKLYEKSKCSFIGNLISLWTNSKYYHVELIVDDKWISSNAEAGGITISPLRTLNFNWDYYDLGEILVTEEQYDNLMDFINSESNCKYDYMGIVFSQVLPFRYHSETKWFCSEIVSKLLQLLLVPEFNSIEPNRMSPADIAKIFNCNKKRL